MAAYLLAYFGYQRWKQTETSNETEEIEEDSSERDVTIDSLRKVNKKLLLVVIILLTIILILAVGRRLVKNRILRKNRRTIR